MRIEELGEAELIKIIRQVVKSRQHLSVGIGDDACVLRDGKTVLTTDAYAQGVHFDPAYMNYHDIGSRCACACISDVVAMAAEPVILLVALALPKETVSSDVRKLYQGMEAVCQKMNCEIAGGDIIAFDRLILSLTALGRADTPRLRSDARPGEFLYLTGYAGLAETGRLLLAREKEKADRSTPRAQAAIKRHLLPLPRIQIIRKLKLQIGALIDTSDGLATDASHIAEMSRVRVVIYPQQIPIHAATFRLCQRLGINPVNFALTAGEDYELLFTSKEKLPNRIINIPVSMIGRIEPGRGLYREENGAIRPIKERGYDHLTTRNKPSDVDNLWKNCG
jgi:thiamine-monophosphate kinase